MVMDTDQAFSIEHEFVGKDSRPIPHQRSSAAGLYEALIVPPVRQTSIFVVY